MDFSSTVFQSESIKLWVIIPSLLFFKSFPNPTPQTLSRASLRQRNSFCCTEDENFERRWKIFCVPRTTKERFAKIFYCHRRRSNEIMNRIITIIMTAVKYRDSMRERESSASKSLWDREQQFSWRRVSYMGFLSATMSRFALHFCAENSFVKAVMPRTLELRKSECTLTVACKFAVLKLRLC